VVTIENNHGNFTQNGFVVYPRKNEQLSKFGDTKSAKANMLMELKKLIVENPLFCDKLQILCFCINWKLVPLYDY